MHSRSCDIEKSIRFPLYKFTKIEHANSFFKTGSLRLGTLYDFRDLEKFRGGVPDDNEGFAPFLRQYVAADGTTRNGLFLTHARNNWIFCCGEIFDEALFSEFEADCCLVIESTGFFHAIDKMLAQECTRLLLRRIKYLDKQSEAIIGNDFAGVIKDARFRSQREIRAFWEPIGGESSRIAVPSGVEDLNLWLKNFGREYALSERKRIPPRILKVPEARQYVSQKIMLPGGLVREMQG